MSRVRLDAKVGYEVVVGRDHAMGFFLQVFADPWEEEDNIIIDKDELFSPNFSRDKLLQEVKPYILNTTHNHRALDLIARGLDPAGAWFELA